MLEPDDHWMPSSPNRVRFFLKMLVAGSIIALGIWKSIDGKLFPLPELAVVIGAPVFLRNAHALASPPYIRLTREGLSLRFWPAGAAIHRFLPFRWYRTLNIPWDRLTGVSPCKVETHGITGFHQLDFTYIDEEGESKEFGIPRALFSRTPEAIASAIAHYHDYEFRWKPLRSSGIVDKWVRFQREYYRSPVTVRYRSDRFHLMLGAIGAGVILAIVGLLLAKVIAFGTSNFVFVIGSFGFIGVIAAIEEILTWAVNWNCHRLILSEEGLSIGHSEASARLYPWAEIVSAHPREVGGFLFPSTDGFEIMTIDRGTVSLTSRYDCEVSQLVRMLTPANLLVDNEARNSQSSPSSGVPGPATAV